MESAGTWPADADWDKSSNRAQNDAFAQSMYENTEEHDRQVIEVVKRIAERHGVPRGHVALAWLWSKPVITAPIVGATKAAHLAESVDAMTFRLSEEEIRDLEKPYVPHPVDGVTPPLPENPPTITSPK